MVQADFRVLSVLPRSSLLQPEELGLTLQEGETVLK
jgi:hypothetical protein